MAKKKKTTDRVKVKGEVFTPRYIVDMMLGLARYSDTDILEKHVMDNSSGTGMFLERIVEEYASAYHAKYGTYNGLKKHLEKYVHGIELNQANVAMSIQRLNIMLKSYYNIDSMTRNMESKVKWDIRCANTLEICDEYQGKMDYVFANPPYVRIHNIPDFDRALLHSFSFAKDGMSDLYLVFYEIGFRMLSESGKMCYISPSSWFKSVAAREMRKYIFVDGDVKLRSLVDFKHFQPFSGITTYVSVSLFDKDNENNEQDIYEVCDGGLKLSYQPFNKLKVEGEYNEVSIVDTSDKDTVYVDMNRDRSENEIKVKNGFATLADDLFIFDEPNDIENTGHVIRVVKAGTGEWKKCIYPYDFNGNPIPEDEFSDNGYCNAYHHLLQHREELENRSIKDTNEWYLFGRTQAIQDTYLWKMSVQQLVNGKNRVKCELVPPGCGVYGGIYIILNAVCEETANELFDRFGLEINSEKFFNYVKSLRHFKSGGYYTFSSKELEQYLNTVFETEKAES